MATSKTIAADIDIVNLALSKLGYPQLSDFDDTTNQKAADLATASFDTYLKVVMEMYPWDFSTEYAQLTSITLPVGVYDYEAAFQIPNGFVKCWHVEGESSADGAEWVQRGSLILTNLAEADGTIKVQLGKFETNVGLYPRTFIDAVAEKCAAEWAGTLIRSTTETELRQILAKDKVRGATSSDGSVGSPRRTQTNATAVTVRGSGQPFFR